MSTSTFRDACAREAAGIAGALVMQRDDLLAGKLASLRQAIDDACAEIAASRDQSRAEDPLIAASVERLTAAAASDAAAQLDDAAARASETAAHLNAALEAADARERSAAGEIERLTQHLDRHAAERVMVEGALTRATEQLDLLTAHQAKIEAALARVTEQRDVLASEKVSRDADTARFASQAARAGARLDRLHGAFESLSDCGSAMDVLKRVANGLAGECARVALFEIRDDQLACVQHAGFEATGDLSKVVIPLTIESVFSASLASDRIQVLTMDGSSAQTRVPFRGEPAHVLVMPIIAAGQRLAVIYADDAGEPQTGPTTMAQVMMVADLLRRHALVRLETLVNEPRSLKDLRAYATLLLEELEYRYDGLVEAEHSPADRMRELATNLDCARQIYAQRADGEPPVAAGLLERELAELMRARADTPFGQDLSEVVAADRTDTAARAS